MWVQVGTETEAGSLADQWCKTLGDAMLANRRMEAGKGHASRSLIVYLGIRGCQESSQPKKGYFQSCGGDWVSLIVRGETQRSKFRALPALSFVPLARAPPKGC